MKLLTKLRKESFWTAAVLAVLVLSLIPLYVISLYNYPLADDFAYGAPVTHAVESGKGAVYVILAIIQQVADKYRNWQGSYAAALFSSLNPFVFRFSFRILSAMILISIFVFAAFYFFMGLAKGENSGAKRTAVITASLLCITCIEFCPRILDCFYWWNGAVNYEVFWCLMLIILGILMRMKASGHAGGLTLAACVLGFLCSGGNYVASLPYVLCIAAITAVYSFLDRKIHVSALLVLCVSGAGFIISVLSPGNSARMGTYLETGMYSLPEVVYYSVQFAYTSVQTFLTPALLLLVLLPVPFMLRYPCGESLRRIPSVILLACMTFLYIVSYAPTVYIEGGAGAARAEDYRFLLFVFFVYVFEWNLTGRLKEPAEQINAEESSKEEKSESALLPEKSAACMGLMALCLCLVAVWYTLPAQNRSRTNSVASAYWIATGAARQYSAEMSNRYALLMNPNVKEIVLEPVISRVPVLYSNTLDAKEDSDYFANQHMAEYFHKDSVVMRTETADTVEN